MKYIVNFNFNCFNKRGVISGRSGQIEVDTDMTKAELMGSKDLVTLIAQEMERKTKQSVMSVDVTEIN
jgi:hypothetical protein